MDDVKRAELERYKQWLKDVGRWNENY